MKQRETPFRNQRARKFKQGEIKVQVELTGWMIAVLVWIYISGVVAMRLTFESIIEVDKKERGLFVNFGIILFSFLFPVTISFVVLYMISQLRFKN